MSPLRVLPISLAILLALGATERASAGAFPPAPFYAWASAPTTLCEQIGDVPRIRLASQPFEWGDLGPSHALQNFFATNGEEFSTSPYQAPSASGAETFPAFSDPADAFPFHYAFRIETRVGDALAYTSALAATCIGPGATSAAIVDWIPGQPASFYRYANEPLVSCESLESGVQLALPWRLVEWRNLPPAAELETTYQEPAGESTSGPVPAPDGDGAFLLGEYAASAPSYPLHAAIRYDTRISDEVVYQSVLLVSCSADGPGTARVFDVPEPARAELALAAIAALGLARSRAGRSA